MSRLSPFVLIVLYKSWMSLKCPFCPDFCPVGPSNKHFYKVKFVETVLFALTSGTINMVKRVHVP